MDNPRLYLWIGLALLAWMNVIQWNRDYGAPATASVPTAPAAGEQAPSRPAEVTAELPQLPAAPGGTATAAGTGTAPPAPDAVVEAPRVRVVTDVLDLDVSLQGGRVVRADLLEYPLNKVKDGPPVRLLTTTESAYQVARSGLRAADWPVRASACSRSTAYMDHAFILNFVLTNKDLDRAGRAEFETGQVRDDCWPGTQKRVLAAR